MTSALIDRLATDFCCRFALLYAVVSATAGCDTGGPRLVPVSGQVVIDGIPLEYGFIRVCPDNARAATGQIGKDGRFTLKTYEDNDGVITGNHRVTIAGGEYVSDSETYWHAPQKYTFLESSGLEVDIQGPTDSLVVELTWDGGKPHRTIDDGRGN